MRSIYKIVLWCVMCDLKECLLHCSIIINIIYLKTMNSKIDKLLLESLDKDKKLASLEHKSERNQELFDRKKNEAEVNINNIQRERDLANEKLNEMKIKFSEIQDDSM